MFRVVVNWPMYHIILRQDLTRTSPWLHVSDVPFTVDVLVFCWIWKVFSKTVMTVESFFLQLLQVEPLSSCPYTFHEMAQMKKHSFFNTEWSHLQFVFPCGNKCAPILNLFLILNAMPTDITKCKKFTIIKVLVFIASRGIKTRTCQEYCQESCI